MSKTIRVVKVGTGYEVVGTTGSEGIATPRHCADTDALRAVLRSMGSSDIGVNNLLKELESYTHVDLRL